jgi:hypothetical protein
MTSSVYDFICSIGELIDKLSIENIKVYDANKKIGDERIKIIPDINEISIQESISRKCGEQRVRLKNEINSRIDEAIRRGGIGVAGEARTYRGGGNV